MYEIEIKAWLRSRTAAEAQLSSFAQYKGFTEKYDTYWVQNTIAQDTAGSHIPVKIRIREETGKPVTAAYKKKEVRSDGMEVNAEHEFTVSSRESFEAFLSGAGFIIDIEKHKSTKSWQWNSVLIEISYLEKLGDFIEIEIITDSDSAETTEAARRLLYEVLDRCGVSSSDIEPRYYSELLSALEDPS